MKGLYLYISVYHLVGWYSIPCFDFVTIDVAKSDVAAASAASVASVADVAGVDPTSAAT